MNHNETGKLQVTLFFAVLVQLLPRQIAPNPNFDANPKPNRNPNQRAIFLGAINLPAFLENEGQIYYMKGDM